MTGIGVSLLGLFIVIVGVALIVGGPRLAGGVTRNTAKTIVQILQWSLRQVLRMFFFVLGAGIRSLTRPRQREPRY